MKKNFSVADAVAIQVDNDYYDLHNDFDLSLFEADFAKKVLRLTFSRVRESEKIERGTDITLTFHEVDCLMVSAGVLGKLIREIVEIGYKSPDDFDHDWLMKEGQTSIGDHFFLRLAGDEFIRVHSKEVQMVSESQRVNGVDGVKA